MLQFAALCAQVVCASVGNAPVLEGYDVDVVQGDITVPRGTGGRDAHGLGAARWADDARRLFPLGQVNYYIETEFVLVSGLAALTDDEPRIFAAIADYEAKTCIRFSRCADEASCGKPYIKFIASTSCRSPVGTWTDNVNLVELDPNCQTGSTIHEIGHSLGLGHEQTRKDRDEYVIVHFENIQDGAEGNFDKDTERDVGPYDYNSIMHYSATTFAKPGTVAIVAPVSIGNRQALSDGDVAALQFMYNECSASWARPTCVASVEAGQTHVIPHSKEWDMEFNALFGSDMTVTYAGTTAPGAQFDAASGSSIGSTGFAGMRYTPSAADAGQTFVLSATFSGGGVSETCSVSVHVAASTTVCFGIGGDQANVCSGHGTCVDDPLTPCDCDFGHVGPTCAVATVCPANNFASFDANTGDWSGGSVDSSFKAEGAASMRINSRASLSLGALTQPELVTFHIAADSGSGASVEFYAGSTRCFNFWRADSLNKWIVTNLVSSVLFDTNQFFKAELSLDWVGLAAQLTVDGQVVGTASMPAGCSGGFDSVSMRGPAWVDDFRVWCSGYLQMSGSLLGGVSITETDLRAGGKTLTLALAGSSVAWATTERAVIDALVADNNEGAGWNALRNSLIHEADVTITSSKITIGPLRANAAFTSVQGSTVTVGLAASMFSTGSLPLILGKQSFDIQGSCAASGIFTFDNAADVTESQFRVSTTVKAVGAGSLEFVDPRFTIERTVDNIQAAEYSAYVRIGASNSQLNVLVNFPGGEIHLIYGVGTRVYLGTGGGSFSSVGGSISTGTFQLLVIEMDWTAHTYTLKIDGTVFASGRAMPDGMEFVSSVSFYSQVANTFVDDVRLTCPTPAAPVPATNPPATNPPATNPPATNPPATNPPATNPPATNPPATNPPATNPPATNPPATNPPATNPPATNPPATNPPATNPPATNPPATNPPATNPPATNPPATNPPATNPPATNPPATNPPATNPPATNPPATNPPATNPPATNPPATNPPATNPPATNPPATNPPATNPPATNPPATNPPATNPPATNPPATNPPATNPPATNPPATNPPATNPPATNPPATNPPATNPPATNPPATNPPATNPPATNPPATNPPATNPPATNPPATNPPATNPPATNPPATNPPATNPPATNPPATNPPATNPPATNPPATNPPATNPPATNPPATNPPATNPPATNPPATNPPATNPPATNPPATNPPATPATNPPATNPPATNPPATNPPATNPPATNPPATNPPATNPPATNPPATNPPATNPPATNPPATNPPATNPPATNPPATNPPATNPPATNPPATNPPATNPPATNPPATNPPATNPPATNPPATNPPATNPPATNPPATNPPATNPPATNPPATNPPATNPPATNPPATNPPATNPPATNPPATNPPATNPPATNPPSTGSPHHCTDKTFSSGYRWFDIDGYKYNCNWYARRGRCAAYGHSYRNVYTANEACCCCGGGN